MRLYVADYLSDTRTLTLQQRGALIDLTVMQWTNGPLPIQPDRLAAMVGATPKEWRGIWQAIRPWWTKTPDGYIREDIEQLRRESEATYRAQAEAGRASAKKRRKKGQLEVIAGGRNTDE